jgi:hypothetical protein
VTLQNPEGLPGQVGNLELTGKEEDDIVAFLKTLSDGYIITNHPIKRGPNNNTSEN